MTFGIGRIAARTIPMHAVERNAPGDNTAVRYAFFGMALVVALATAAVTFVLRRSSGVPR